MSWLTLCKLECFFILRGYITINFKKGRRLKMRVLATIWLCVAVFKRKWMINVMSYIWLNSCLYFIFFLLCIILFLFVLDLVFNMNPFKLTCQIINFFINEWKYFTFSFFNHLLLFYFIIAILFLLLLAISVSKLFFLCCWFFIFIIAAEIIVIIGFLFFLFVWHRYFQIPIKFLF